MNTTRLCRNWALALAIFGVVSLAGLGAAHAARPGDISTKWPVNDDDPSANIPSVEERNSDPLAFAYFLQDLVARATMAYEVENWQDTVKYYEALAKAVPDIARPFSSLCVAYAKLQQFSVAQAYCAKVITMQGAKVIDHLRLVDITLTKPQLTQEDVDTVLASLDHLRAHAKEHPQPLKRDTSATFQKAPWQPGMRPETGEELARAVRDELKQSGELKEQQLPDQAAPAPAESPHEPVMHVATEVELRTCKLAALIGDTAMLGECMQALESYGIDERLLLPFAWAQALHTKDREGANQLLEQGARYGLSEETLAAMRAEHRKVFMPWLGLWKIATALGLAGLAIWGLYKLWRRRARHGATRRVTNELEAETGR